jgi:hypothetical protein
MWRQHADAAIAERLRDACARYDPEAIARTLRRAAEVTIDDGGRAGASRHPVHGARDAALAIARMLQPGSEVAVASVNGSPGLTVRVGDRVVGVLTFTTRRRAIERLWFVVDPSKLATFNRT